MDKTSKELFNEANEALYKKGFYVSNMVYDNEYYEIADGEGKTVMDYLTVSHLTQLARIIENRRM